MDGLANNDDTMKQLLEEHSNLLKKTLLISTRRKSIDSKPPHRGELALDLSGALSTNSTWPNCIAATEENDVSVYEKETNSSPRYSHLSTRSRNISKEAIPQHSTTCLVSTGIEDVNQMLNEAFETETSTTKVATANQQETPLAKGNLYLWYIILCNTL